MEAPIENRDLRARDNQIEGKAGLSALSPESGRSGQGSAAVRSGLAVACALVSFLVTNGSIYPAVAQVNPVIREGATLFGVAVLAAVVMVAYRAPWLLRPRLFSGIALGSLTLYLGCDLTGLSYASPGLLLLGSCADSLAEAWLFVLAYVAFAQLPDERRPAVALGACLCAYLTEPFVGVLAPPVAVILNGILFAVLFWCVRPLVRRPLEEVSSSEPQAEMAVANPRSYLPVSHLLFVTVFVFSVAQGFALALPGPFNEAPALPLAFVPLAVILLVYIVGRRLPNADGLFSLCALLIIAGMVLQPSDRLVSAAGCSLAGTFIDAGAACFSLLLVLLVGSIAARNRLMALPTAALMLGLYWLGVCVGAASGNAAMALFGRTADALVWVNFAASLGFVAFCFLALKGVSFVEVVGGILPPEPAEVPSVEADSLERRVAKVAERFGLTPREHEVCTLLAQGRTVGVIRERLVISLNTARFHTKNIYAKLGVHSQQELIDLVEGCQETV